MRLIQCNAAAKFHAQQKTSFTSRGCVGTAKNDPSLTAQWDDFSQLMSSDVTETFCQRKFSAKNVLLRYLLTKLIAFYHTHDWRLWNWNLKKLSYHHIKLREWFFFQLSLQKHCRKNLCATLVFCHFHSSHRCTIKAFFSSEITSKRRPYPKMKGFCHSIFLQLDCYSCQETLPETILGSL